MNNKRKSANRISLTREELLLENEKLRCENELLKKVTSLSSSGRESQSASHNGIKA
jgi:hypothetical protein